MDLEDASSVVELKSPVTLTELFQVFGTYVGQVIGPLCDDLRSFRAEMANQLSQLRAEVSAQNIEIAGLNAAFKLRQDNIKLVEAKVAALEKRVDDHDDILSELKTVMRALRWLGVILGGSIVTLIWSLITGQVQLSFK